MRRRRIREKKTNKTNAINPPRAKFRYMEGVVTDTGLAGKGVGEGNVGSAVTAGGKVAVGFIVIKLADSVAVGEAVGSGVSLRIFKSETTTSCVEPS